MRRLSVAPTLRQLIRDRAEVDRDRLAYSFAPDGGEVSAAWTWGDAYRRSLEIAAWLQEERPSISKAILLYQPGLEFIGVLFACLLAGVTAIPAYSVDKAKRERATTRLIGIILDSGADCILTDELSFRILRDDISMNRFGSSIEWYVTERVEHEAPVAMKPVAVRNTAAIVQYTSGSVAEPRGVVLSDANILANELCLQAAHDYNADSTIVNWVPVAHDWGLINGIIQPAFSGCRTVLMPPEAVVARPVRWLRTIAGHSDVCSGGPNFIYDLCVDRIPDSELKGLDLSRWRRAGVSAGPVMANTLRRFAARFERYGFCRDSFYAGYGLAEATLLVCDSERGRAPRIVQASRSDLEINGRLVPATIGQPAVELVACGKPTGTRVIVMSRCSDGPCRDGEFGEICIAGDAVSERYLSGGEPLRSMVSLEGEQASVFRTGDIGCLHEGELFVAGRIADIIALRGRNVFPYDLELCAERSHREIRPGGSVAFECEVGRRRGIVTVHELRECRTEAASDIVAQVRRALAQDHDVTPIAVVLVKAGSVPKTSSGKPRRKACRDAYLRKTLSIIDEHCISRSTSYT